MLLGLLHRLTVFAVEESEDRRRCDVAIVLQVRRIFGAISMLEIRKATAVNSNLNLAVHHVLVEGQVRLGRENAVFDEDALDLGVRARPPYVHLGVF